MKPSMFYMPAKWFVDVWGSIEDVSDCLSEITTPEYGNIAFALELSEDPDRVLSAINQLYFILGKQMDAYDIIQELLCGLIDDRWIELFIMDIQVMREVVKLFYFLPEAPNEIIHESKKLLSTDDITVNYICNLWLEREWEITDDFAYIIRNCENAWMVLHKLHADAMYLNSKEVLYLVSKLENDKFQQSILKLIRKNTSCLEYLLDLDIVNAEGLKTTIDTIAYFDIWKIVLANKAATPIINFIIGHSETIFGKIDIRKWLMPLIEKNELVADYIQIDDLRNFVFTDKIFYNIHASGILIEWIVADGLVEPLFHELIIIASIKGNKLAYEIHKLLDKYNHLTDKLNPSEWDDLMNNEYNHKFVEKYLTKQGKVNIWHQLVVDYKLAPYWKESENESVWALENLTPYTVNNISDALYEDIRAYPSLLSYDNWITLFLNRKGVEIGMKAIDYVIESGCLFALLKSPHLTKEELVNIATSHNAIEFCDEEDFISIAKRMDAFDFNFESIREVNKELNYELLTVWHHPDRLSRMAKLAGLQFYDYVKCM